MTGRGQHGGPSRRDHWRGGREETASPDRDRGAATRRDGSPFSTWVEVEELPPQSLAPRHRSRLPVTGLVAIAAVAALLAGGLGLLGGRPGAGALPAASGAGLVASPPAAARSGTEPPPIPRVTPWVSCSGAKDEAPQPVLEVDGQQHFGQVEVLDVDIAPNFDAIPIYPRPRYLDAVEVPMDAVAEIWIVGGSCAMAWNVALVGPAAPEPQVLESVANEGRDPAVAAQNRLQVFVAPHAGDHLLRAVLFFENVVVRATWWIHVPALEPPAATFEGESGGIATVIGCDVTQRLVNDWEERLNPCARDVGRDPAPRAEIRAGESLEFALAGWAARNTTVVCGFLTERTFVPLHGSGCIGERDPLFAGVRFSAPTQLGPMTIAISTCATRLRIVGSGFEELCGTWYANVRIRE